MKSKTVFFCTECGNETPRWAGQCPACKSWNTLVEQKIETSALKASISSKQYLANYTVPTLIEDVECGNEARFSTGISEFDRVLGGGAVLGSLVLIGGEPGIGKSTLLLQICCYLCNNSKVLYVTGEESEKQLKMRAQRLGVDKCGLLVMSETDVTEIISTAEKINPGILIVDSVQTLFNNELNSTPGSVAQVKECTLALMHFAKKTGTTVFLIGHVNKEGAIAGPKVLEHMVDCVLYIEGEKSHNYRMLRCAKNRFGSTNELGMFEMLDNGLSEVTNPSESLLEGRPENTPGTCVTCVMEGSRPILAEIQALVTPTSFNVPRRNSNGIEYNRAMMLLAVLEKRTKVKLGTSDAYINVIAGLNIQEPGADIATILAIMSSSIDKAINPGFLAFGEVGLTGELRPVAQTNLRLNEAARLGFKECLISQLGSKKVIVPDGIKIIPVKNVFDAIKYVFA